MTDALHAQLAAALARMPCTCKVRDMWPIFLKHDKAEKCKRCEALEAWEKEKRG